VLKRRIGWRQPVYSKPATFGWLCVETSSRRPYRAWGCAATFGWLCVETGLPSPDVVRAVAATFWWLCVETA